MPAVITHKTIMLLARERLVEIRDLLQDKVDIGVADLTDLDRQLLAMAKEAARVFNTEPRPRTELSGILFTELEGPDNDRYPISQYAVLGSMGPDITGFSNILIPGQGWVFDTVHKGTPDGDRELVNAQTCDFIMTFWNKARDLVTAEYSDVSERNKILDRMRAYVLGHLSHIATDVISHPYVSDYQWQQATKDIAKFHSEIEYDMEAEIAIGILRRASLRTGQDWDDWWLDESIPPQFFTAYAQSLEQVYTTNGQRRHGYKEFEDHLTSLGFPALNADFVKDGYSVLRHGVVSKGYVYGYWSWWGWLTLLAVPAVAMPLVVAAMPNGSKMLLPDSDQYKERAWMEFLATPMAFSLPAMIGYGALVGSVTTGGIAGRYWFGMIGAIVSAILAIVLFATTAADELHPGFSWTVLFAIPLVIAIVQLILGAVDLGGTHKGRGGVTMLFALPLVMWILFLLGFSVLFIIIDGIFRVADSDYKPDTPFKSPGFWITFALWTITCFVLWFWAPTKLRSLGRIPEQPKGDLVTRRFVRLFDDATLHRESQLASVNVPDEVYPSGRRKLLKLWWTGTGDLYVRSDRYQLHFSAHEDGRDAQIVHAPIVPMTLEEFLNFLKRTVKQPGTNDTDKLEGAFTHDEEKDYRLPIGAAFSDHGDDEDTRAEHDNKAATFIKLGTSEENSEYILYHAPKVAQSVGYGERGAVPPERNLGEVPVTHDGAEEGYEFLHNPGIAQATDTLMSYAADFSAILSMGAVTHMKTLSYSDGNNLSKIYQVFRNWNLDRRRVNEWRTIVAGGAANENAANSAGYFANMLGGSLRPDNHDSWHSPLHDSDAAAFTEGEQTARQLGWVKVLREWLAVRQEDSQNPLADTAFTPGNPSNRALSRAMAYLFDLNDPAGAP